MPKITSVEPQKKFASRRIKRFNIFLDGVFVFGADEDLVVDNRLVVGKEFTESDVERLIEEAEVGKLMERMYRLFNIRQRSEKEVRDYLKNLSFKRKLKNDGISDTAIDSTIERLKKKGMIDDLNFARAWTEARSKKKGPVAIKGELIQKGIDKEIIEEVIGLGFMPEGEEKVATQILEKKINSWKNLEPVKLKRKAYDSLLRRGFRYETVKSIVEKLFKKS